jgi:predicted secreted protein
MAQGVNEVVEFAVSGHRRDRQHVLEKLQPLEAGRIRHQTKDGNGDWRDITDELIAEHRAEIKMHDQMIAAYEKMKTVP